MINKIKENINKIIDFIILEDCKKTFISLKNLNIKELILFFLLMPLSFIFIVINFFTFIISLFMYFSLFFIRLIKKRILKKKIKNIIYKRRFKYLKNIYIIFLEKVLITYTKQRAFLVFYILLKTIIKKDKELFKKEILIYYLKAISNRYIVSFIFGLPYIMIYCNLNLTKIIINLKEYNYENKKAFFNTIILNILKDLSNNYNKLILKLKIKIYKNKIVFNSKKDLINILKYKKEFNKDFNSFKRDLNFNMMKHIIKKKIIQKENGNTLIKEYCKEHPTLMLKLKDKKSIIYINETSSKNFMYFKYHKEINNYIEEIHKNMFMHKGSISKNKDVFYTPIIKSEISNTVITQNINKNIILNAKEENLNKIVSAFSLNLNNEMYLSKFLEKNNKDKEEILTNIKLKKIIDYFNENKDLIEKNQLESILGMNFFWTENEKIIENLNIEERIKLCIELNLELNTSSKEISFNLFKDIISKK